MNLKVTKIVSRCKLNVEGHDASTYSAAVCESAEAAEILSLREVLGFASTNELRVPLDDLVGGSMMGVVWVSSLLRRCEVSTQPCGQHHRATHL